jgi:hypothetical protein
MSTMMAWSPTNASRALESPRAMPALAGRLGPHHDVEQMPSHAEIIDGLTRIADAGFPVAVALHLACAAAFAAIALGWRPSNRTCVQLLVVPLVTASGFALAFGMTFNAAVLAMLAGFTVAMRRLFDRTPVQTSDGAAVAIGACVLLLGITYPHFLVDYPSHAYLWGAPMGLLPCPTLALLVGAALVARGFGSRAWSVMLAIVGTFYGAYGALRLGVGLDILLLVGSTALLVAALRKR